MRALQSTASRDMVLRAGIAAAAFVSGRVFAAGASCLPLDDAYIHLTFARNLGRGLGFCFNPGRPSLGFSSPLWVMLLGLFSRLGLPLEKTALTAGLLAFALSSALLFDLVRVSVLRAGADERPGGERLASGFGTLAGLGLVACGNMLWLAASGMEAMLFLALGLAAVLLVTSGKPRPLAGGVALGLLVLTRSTGWDLVLILGAVGLVRGDLRKRMIAALIVAAALALPWHLFTLYETGHFIAPTRAGKLASNLFNAGLSITGASRFLFLHLVYLMRADRGVLCLLFFAILAAAAKLGLWLRDGRGRVGFRDALSLTPAGALAVWAAAHLLMHSILFRSTAYLTPYHNLRYQVMLIPAVIAAAGLVLASLAMTMERRGAREGGIAPLTAGMLAALMFFTAPLTIELLNANSWRRLYLAGSNHLTRVHRAAADWARETLPEDARIAAFDIGMLGYYGGHYVIDLGGLIDPGIIPYLEARRVGPYMVEEKADYYLAVESPNAENLTGVMKDNHLLYELEFLRRFDYPRYVQPVFIHSFAIEAYKVKPLSRGVK